MIINQWVPAAHQGDASVTARAGYAACCVLEGTPQICSH